jgi:deoxyribose-phosphate aldolase
LLQPHLDRAALESGCVVAARHGVASVCLLPYFVADAFRMLSDSDVVVSTTIGFPHGVQPTPVKVLESRVALDAGAGELDAVLNTSQIRSGNLDSVRAEVDELVRLTHDAGARLKIIFENCYLADAQKVELCRICSAAGVDWVKTSTGFGSGGATPHDVELMRRNSAASVQVKASGGIADLDGLIAYLRLGATRIGTSRTEAILKQAANRFP